MEKANPNSNQCLVGTRALLSKGTKYIILYKGLYLPNTKMKEKNSINIHKYLCLLFLKKPNINKGIVEIPKYINISPAFHGPKYFGTLCITCEPDPKI